MSVLDPEIQEDISPAEELVEESAEALRQRHLDFEREALPHMDALYNFALRMTSDPDEADDLLQETYLKAYRFFDKFEQGTNCKAWLFRIMKNSFINIYRRSSKEPDKVDYNDVEEFYHSIRAESTDPNDLEEKIFSNILDDDVSTALESLPEEFRTVVILCDIEGFTYEEIAEFVECPIGTVRSRLHRGRKMLRGKLFDYAKQRGYADEEDTVPAG
ncbi:MAG: sigma-70 family RNA polymerase sigma factor [Bacteroidota bacterium]|jgi:RNA polymerase sigma-70 factor (ECF subfamily)|nr:sigma-70 family RNA polymerase sigma factor [Bacteroidota bacterium]